MVLNGFVYCNYPPPRSFILLTHLGETVDRPWQTHPAALCCSLSTFNVTPDLCVLLHPLISVLTRSYVPMPKPLYLMTSLTGITNSVLGLAVLSSWLFPWFTVFHFTAPWSLSLSWSTDHVLSPFVFVNIRDLYLCQRYRLNSWWQCFVSTCILLFGYFSTTECFLGARVVSCSQLCCP